MEIKNCPECGRAIIGRLDKKFCSDLCRHSFNNRRRAESGSYIKNVNAILRKNRTVLSELIPLETAKISRNKLYDKGFNFNFITSLYTTKKGTIYYYCYEFGYMPIDNDYFLLVKRKVEEWPSVFNMIALNDV